MAKAGTDPDRVTNKSPHFFLKLDANRS
jgi:hypothetical protein